MLHTHIPCNIPSHSSLIHHQFSKARRKRVAFDEAELAADHLIERAHVAIDVDPFDIDLRALLHSEDDIEGVLGKDTVLPLDRNMSLKEALQQRRQPEPA